MNRLHRLLSELIPARPKGHDRRAGQGDARHRPPRDIAGKTRRRLAVEQFAELIAIEKKMKSTDQEFKVMVLARGSTLMDLPGVGPVVAARILADVGDVARFVDRNRFASWTGTAPLDASSGEHMRHRLSRAGNRKMNHMIHIAAITQTRLDTPGRTYYRRKLAAGKTRIEAMRCLKRRISDAVYRQLLIDAARPRSQVRTREGNAGRLKNPARSTPTRYIDTSDRPLPDPHPRRYARRRRAGRARQTTRLTQRGAEVARSSRHVRALRISAQRLLCIRTQIPSASCSRRSRRCS